MGQLRTANKRHNRAIARALSSPAIVAKAGAVAPPAKPASNDE